MPHQNEWTKLREAVCRLRSEGEQGFEGLLASLFEAETRIRFFVARKGDQPVGDVYSPRAAVALQAKRYTTSKISENEIEGDIDRALREAPALEVFVVVATKSLAQLATRLTHKTNETGLDILPLSLGDGVTNFGALCVSHHEVIQRFIPELEPEWQQWALEESQRSETNIALLSLRENLSGLTTRKSVSENSRVQCAERFNGHGANLRTHNPIKLAEAVDRPRLVKQLQEWWEEEDATIAVLKGEEGTGKTWVAASFAEILNHSETSVLFWLDSLSWANARTVEDLLHIALERLDPQDERRRGRILRKIFQYWQEPVLLVLDGANERNAWNGAERLLEDYAAHRKAFRPHIRLLFTSRPKSSPDVDFWTGCRVVSVGAFDHEEFEAALKRFAPDLTPRDLTRAVKELAVIPRYFRLCIRLREQFNSLQHLTKELLFWADLRSKLFSRDPQIAALDDALHGTPEEILTELARRAGWPTNGKPSVVTGELQKTFPNFLKARTDLAEQRILLSADFSTTALSSDHVILGWALFLRELAESHNTETYDQICDRLQNELEPAASNDSKVRAIHLAAVLSFLDVKGNTVTGRRSRASLLSLWVSNHNAWVNCEALGVFVQCDLPGYILAVEMLFRERLFGSLEATLVAPLAQIWRDRKDEARELHQVLERWLRLIYPVAPKEARMATKHPQRFLLRRPHRNNCDFRMPQSV